MVGPSLFPLLTVPRSIPQTVDAGNFSNPNLQIDRNAAPRAPARGPRRISIDLKISIQNVACVGAMGSDSLTRTK